LPAKVSIYFPRVVGSVQEPEKYRLSLEYYAYSNLGEKMMGTFDPEFWRKAFDYIFAFGEKCKQVIPMYSVKMKTESDCIDMYITKTEREHASLVENFEFFRDLQKYDSLKVNGKILRSFDIVWPVIKDKIQKDYVNPNFSLIHGDCCFSNILYGVNSVTQDVILKFIDPRGTFGKTRFFGDYYYDLAKLSHSCSGGYEYLINDRFFLDVTGENFDFGYLGDGNAMSQINQLFISYIQRNGYDYAKMKTLEGTIFIGMCARHYDSLQRQKAMYITGLDILNDIYETLL
jgi:hypothetical protein